MCILVVIVIVAYVENRKQWSCCRVLGPCVLYNWNVLL